jgi:hypothetical protein
MTEEIWKPVLGYDGLYEVSSLGRVKSLDRITIYANGIRKNWKGRIMKTQINQKRGYSYRTPVIMLCKNSKIRCVRVSNLVCEAFHGPRPAGYQCMHLDGNAMNNNSANLAWGTAKENCNEKNRRARLSAAAKIHIRKMWDEGILKKKYTACAQYSLSGILVAEYDSIDEASKKTGISADCISQACRGASKTSGGYMWKRKEK